MNSKLLSSIQNPILFWFLLLVKLPMGILAGLRLKEASPERAVVCVKYQYVTKNPFRSIYFGCLAMAAELSSGVLCLVYTMGLTPFVSVLIIHMEAKFVKKGRGKVYFTCENGLEIGQAARETKQTGEPRTVVTTSVGRDEKGMEIARFQITWSFKAKKPVELQ